MDKREGTMEDMVGVLRFFSGKKVFVTGHTGFKGTWLCKVLVDAGAEVTGYALEPPVSPNLFALSGVGKNMRSIIGDVRDREKLLSTFLGIGPDIVFHLAAQPLVLEGYRDPGTTYETNIMGTVNILECLRLSDGPCSFVNVTTDKVYENKEWPWGYREKDSLGGHDPYSNSKSCSELISGTYRRSFLEDRGVSVSTARTGNVIGGGDFAENRIIPDCIRAAIAGEPVLIRNPNAIRPWQHVLEPILAYLLLAAAQYKDPSYAGAYNIGPNESDCISTAKLAELFCRTWGNGQTWRSCPTEGNEPHEANFLKLDCSLLKSLLHWKPTWNVERAVQETVSWTKTYIARGNIAETMLEQITSFLKEQEREARA